MDRYLFDAFPENVSGLTDSAQTIAFSIGEALKSKERHQLPVTRYDVPDQAHPGQFIQKYWHPSHTPVSGHLTTISGFGIGLYLCSEIITRHEGKIWLVSEMGKGSTFNFSLPADNSDAAVS